MNEHPLNKLVKIIDLKIQEHRNSIEDIAFNKEKTQGKIVKAKEGLKTKNIKAVVLVGELIEDTKKIHLHEGAIAALEDLKFIIKEAIK